MAVFTDEVKQLIEDKYWHLVFVDEFEQWKCLRCGRICLDQQMILCGHFLCLKCSLQLNLWKYYFCRFCQQKSFFQEIKTDIDDVYKLQVHCLNYKNNCEEIVQLQYLPEHYRSCQKNCINMLLAISFHQKADKVKRESCQAMTDVGFEQMKLMENFKSSLLAENNKLTKRYEEFNAKMDDRIQELKQLMKNEKQLTEKKEKRCINILLLGETKCGKSTLINAFAQSLKYETFEEAQNGQEQLVIAAKFVHTDEDYNEYQLRSGGRSENECLEEGQSTTSECQSYVFDMSKELRVRWIDSAGFASSWGPEHDQATLTNINNTLRNYKYINAIAVVMESNMCRLTTQISYCLQQSLSNWHQKAAPHFIFVFTHGTQCGDAIDTVITGLRNYKIEDELINKIINNSNVFSFQNDGLVKLSVVEQGMSLTKEELQQSSAHWNAAKCQFKHLINYVVNLEAHNVLHSARVHDTKLLLANISVIIHQQQWDNSKTEKNILLEVQKILVAYLRTNALIVQNTQAKEYYNGCYKSNRLLVPCLEDCLSDDLVEDKSAQKITYAHVEDVIRKALSMLDKSDAKINLFFLFQMYNKQNVISDEINVDCFIK